MPEMLGFITLIIPLERLPKLVERAVLPELMLKVEHDEAFAYFPSCDSAEVENWINELSKAGFCPYAEINGDLKWVDVCVVDQITGVTLPCDWLPDELSKPSL